ncbi:hypothetical protein J7L13_00700 [bacterium]|nr:hypothetical protein [bacterium]
MKRVMGQLREKQAGMATSMSPQALAQMAEANNFGRFFELMEDQGANAEQIVKEFGKDLDKFLNNVNVLAALQQQAATNPQLREEIRGILRRLVPGIDPERLLTTDLRFLALGKPVPRPEAPLAFQPETQAAIENLAANLRDFRQGGPLRIDRTSIEELARRLAIVLETQPQQYLSALRPLEEKLNELQVQRGFPLGAAAAYLRGKLHRAQRLLAEGQKEQAVGILQEIYPDVSEVLPTNRLREITNRSLQFLNACRREPNPQQARRALEQQLKVEVANTQVAHIINRVVQEVAPGAPPLSKEDIENLRRDIETPRIRRLDPQVRQFTSEVVQKIYSNLQNNSSSRP